MTTKRRCAAALWVAAIMTASAMSVPASAAESLEGQQRIQQISDAATLSGDGAQPWYLRLTFSLNDLNGKHKEDGTIEEWWVSGDQYKIVVKSPSLNETLPEGGKDYEPFSDRESYLVHLLLAKVVRPIPYYKSYAHLTAVQIDQDFGTVKLSCVRVGQDTDKSILSSTWDGSEYCTTAGQDILRAELEQGHFAYLRNSMGIFRGVHVAVDHRISYEGVVAITGHVEQLHVLTADQIPVDLKKPADGKLPGVLLPARLLKSFQPVYPVMAKEQRQQGSVVLGGVLATDGTVHTPYVIASRNAMFTESAIAAVHKWKYEPSIRGGVPIDTSVDIRINFAVR